MKQQPGIHVDYKSRNLNITVKVIGAITVIVLAIIFYQQVSIIILLLGGITVIYALSGVFGKIMDESRKFVGLKIDVQRLEQERAKTDEARAKARAAWAVIQTNNGLLVSGKYDDLTYYPPTARERDKLLPSVIDGEALPAPLDFFTAMLGTQQPYKIIAEQRRGKSYLAMHITDKAKSRGETCIVIGTKHEVGEWPNAYRYLIKSELVQAGLLNIINETNKRNEIFQRRPLLRVFLDDWINTAICYPALAQEFLELAATKMLTAGIVPYFLLQGDGNDDWGNKKSAMLKNNFTGLWVSGPRDEQGDPIPQLNTAVLRYPGSREELPVRLPSGFPKLGLGQLPAPRVRTPEPNEQERRVLEMWQANESYRTITMAVWNGKFGDYYNRKVDEIVRKYGQ